MLLDWLRRILEREEIMAISEDEAVLEALENTVETPASAQTGSRDSVKRQDLLNAIREFELNSERQLATLKQALDKQFKDLDDKIRKLNAMA
jgi:hypothetical protein